MSGTRPQRNLRAVVVVAALVVSATACGQVGADSSPNGGHPWTRVPQEHLPASLAALDMGEPTTMPWWQDGGLHVDGRVIRTRSRRIAYRAGTTLVAPEVMDNASRWSIVDGGELVRLPTFGRTRTPYISADGRWVTWIDEVAPSTDADGRKTDYRLVRYDARAHTIVDTFEDRRTVESEDGGNAIWLRGIDLDGNVFFSIGYDAKPVLWRPGSEPSELVVNKFNGLELAQRPRGISVYQASGDDDGFARYGTVDKDGRFEEVGRLGSDSGDWSGGADAYAYEIEIESDADRDGDGIGDSLRWVDRVDDGRSVQLGLPVLRDLGLIGWESADTLIFWDHRTNVSTTALVRSVVVRCNAVTGACERVPDGPEPGPLGTMPGASE